MAVEPHEHNGQDAPRVPAKELDGFLRIFSSAPTHTGLQGEALIVASDSSFSLYTYLDGSWRKTELA